MANRDTRSYNPIEVSCIIGGSIIEGFAEGTFINVAYRDPLWSYQRGLSSGARIRNPNRAAELTLTLLQTSPSNAELQAYLTRARAGTGIDYFSILIRNNSGGESAAADTAWIMGEPALTFSNNLENREWRIETGNLLIKYDTNYSVLSGSDN